MLSEPNHKPFVEDSVAFFHSSNGRAGLAHCVNSASASTRHPRQLAIREFDGLPIA